MAGRKLNSFWNRNLVTIIMIPSLVGIHLGWMLLQKNEALVREDEKIDLPVVTSVKYLWNKINGNTDTDPKNET